MSCTTVDAIKGPSVELFAKMFRAYMGCNDEVQAIIGEMVEVLNCPDSDVQDRAMAGETIAEALFPGDHNGRLGIGLRDAEKAAAESSDEGRVAIEELDREEAVFAERLRDAIDRSGMTQVQLADKAGVGQPAISMMLSRQCRPQQRTVKKLADALGVAQRELWPHGE